MWHRTDDFRQGRVHPMCTSRVRVDLPRRQRADLRAAAHQRRDRLHARLRRDPTATLATLPRATSATRETIFTLTQNVPYNYGVVTQLLNEVYE